MSLEFRWLPVGIWDGRPHVKVGHEVAVLQTRSVVGWRGSDNFATPLEPEWSEWSDVPISSPSGDVKR